MARETNNARPWLAALLGLVAGLIIGLIIAWGVWPVSYKNTLPQDLRSAERDQYLAMVATSLAATGDAQAASERLQTWPTEDLAAALANLQERLLATDPATAAAVEQLASALNLGAASSAARPGAAPSTGSSVSSPAWKTLCTSAVWIALILLGVVALAYLFRRWRAARSRRTGPAIAGVPQAASPPGSPEEIAQREKEEWTLKPADQTADTRTLAGDASGSDFYDDEDDIGMAPAVVAATAATSSPAPRPAQPAAYVAPSAEPVRRAPTVVVPPTAAGAAVVVAGTKTSGSQVGDYMAVFHMGEPNYDEAFDINDPTDGYMGQCGLQLNEPVGRNRDQAVALQAWLWDSSDPDTRTKVLMSEGAYRDTAMRSQQAGQHEALQVRAGTEFELESHDLLLRGRVEKADYIDQEPNRSVFAELQVRMQIYRKA
jgi:hypothetical protein